jgi:dTDP-4-dehydrorhamnose 3,5-epimerase
MKFTPTTLRGAYIIELEPIRDERGFFARMFCKNDFKQIGFDKEIVQINHSLTKQKGAIRGLHYQLPPACETKIIRCIHGAVFDVMVDIRAGSPSFLKWFGIELTKENMRMAFIPEGFAHGFQTLAENSHLIYHHSNFYSAEYERGLRFDDPLFAIRWPLSVAVISVKDQSYELLDRTFKGIEL